MIAADVMTPNPATVTPETPLAEALDVMWDLDVRHVPVVDRGQLVGMLSDRDVTGRDLGRSFADSGRDASDRELRRSVGDLMSTDVISVEADSGLDEVVDLLVEHRVGALPVVEASTRTVVGIVSYIDVLRALQDLLRDE